MGWQGEVRRRKELERVAARFGVSWQEIRIFCWRDNRNYRLEVRGVLEREAHDRHSLRWAGDPLVQAQRQRQWVTKVNERVRRKGPRQGS